MTLLLRFAARLQEARSQYLRSALAAAFGRDEARCGRSHHGHRERKPLPWATGSPRRRELLAVEREAVELALAARAVSVPMPERRPLAEALLRSGQDLTGEQRMLVHHAGTRSDRVVCIGGVAGSGKTLALRVLADARPRREWRGPIKSPF